MRLNDTDVRGHELKVTANLHIESEDMSGQTSQAGRVHKGFKPKTLACSLKIRYRDIEQLTTLAGLAESVDDDGKQTVYTIVQNTAKAMNIRQVMFMDNLNASEDETLKLWNVSFTLVEFSSVPELAEKRQSEKTVSEQAVEAETLSAGSAANHETILKYGVGSL